MAIGTTWAARSDASRVVLTVARPVAAGARITVEDLGTTRIGRAGVVVVPVGDAEQVVGRTAVVDLLPGTLLTPSMLSEQATPAAGDAVVSLALKPGAIPEEIVPGTRVRVVAVGAQAPAAVEGRVLSLHADTPSGTVVVSLLVREADADAVVRAAAGESVSLVLLSPSGRSR